MSAELAIAVIEDDPSLRTALVGSLESMGYGARGFGSAEDFIAGDGEANCDGIDLQRLLAARGATQPVVMISATVDARLKAEAKASGAVCLLQKPFPMDALINCLERRSNF